jgi:sugar lactone lactonase YvrE
MSGTDPSSDPFATRDEKTQAFTPSQSAPRTSDDLAISRLGSYQLDEELARGGMGIVYRATDSQLQRTVAIKTILSGTQATAEDIQRFRIEAEAYAQLDHPNIVPIYEVGQEGQFYFLVMKYLSGGSLASRITELRNDPRHGVKVLAQVARAVHHAHQRGILHRDLKPHNIMLDDQGQPFVTDFGLAKFSQVAERQRTDSGLTQTGAILGTPSYMSPEQALGNKDVTVASDIYSLGAILYEMLTGMRPYQGESAMDTMLLVIRGELKPIREINPSVDFELELICRRCLEKEPSSRYASAEQMAEDLEAYLAGEPISIKPPTWRGKAGLWLKRHARVAAAAIITGVVFGVGFSASWWLMMVKGLNVPYERLPSSHHPLLSIDVPELIARVLVFASLLGVSGVGLVATLLGRQSDRATDLVVGLTVGLVMTLCALPVAVCGPFQSFALSSTVTDLDLLLNTSSLADGAANSTLTDAYPDLSIIAPRERRLVVARKVATDLIANLVTATAITIGVTLSIMLSVSISGTLLAGYLYRRTGSVWGTVLPYVEIAVPMSLFAVLATLPLLGGLAGMSVVGFFGSLFGVVLRSRTVFYWLVVTMGALLVATTLAWGRRHWVARALSHCGWIGCFFVVPWFAGHNPDVYYNSTFDNDRHIPNVPLALVDVPQIYWTDATHGQVVRCNLDGTGSEIVYHRLNRPRGLAFYRQTILVADYGFGEVVQRDLRSNMAQVLVANAPGVRGIAIDDTADKIYWADRDLRVVLRADLDGRNEETVIAQHLAYPYTLQVDPVEQRLYVEDHLAGAIFRCRLDGTDLVRFADVSSINQNRPGGMALDVVGRYLFYKDAGGSRIQRISLDGGLPEVVLDGLANPNGLHLDPTARKIYWAETAVWRANLDGTAKESIPGTESDFISSIYVLYPEPDGLD